MAYSPLTDQPPLVPRDPLQVLPFLIILQPQLWLFLEHLSKNLLLPGVFPASSLAGCVLTPALPPAFFVTLGRPSLTILFKIACPLHPTHRPPFSVLFYFIFGVTVSYLA